MISSVYPFIVIPEHGQTNTRLLDNEVKYILGNSLKDMDKLKKKRVHCKSKPSSGFNFWRVNFSSIQFHMS